MITQNQIKALPIFYLVKACGPENLLPGQPYCATSLDYGFDFKEDELARELSAPLPANLADQPNYHIEADEFEMLYRWFTS